MKLMEKIENIFAAVAFAEEGDSETARRIAGEGCEAGVRTDESHACGDGCKGGMHLPAKA